MTQLYIVVDTNDSAIMEDARATINMLLAANEDNGAPPEKPATKTGAKAKSAPAKKTPAKAKSPKDPLAALRKTAQVALDGLEEDDAASVLSEFGVDELSEIEDKEALDELIEMCTEDGDDGDDGGDGEDVTPEQLKEILQDYRKEAGKDALAEALTEFEVKTIASAAKLDQEQINELYDMVAEALEDE